MTAKIKFWQWPNVLAIDASLVAVAWLDVLASEQSAELNPAAYGVLALSVWLTYLADRLFDAHPRRPGQLTSARHQFAKRRHRVLWLAWAALLALDISLAVTALGPSTLIKGFVLLGFCLAYTGLNHLFARRFFPKELLVAIIFVGGTQVFLPEATEWPTLVAFTLLCLVNCLAIGWRERPVDALLEVRSLSSILNLRWGAPLLLLGLGFGLFSDGMRALLPSLLTLAAIQIQRDRFSRESFRVLCDAALLLGPLVYFFSFGVFVR
jgi:hypothetical protein